MDVQENYNVQIVKNYGIALINPRSGKIKPAAFRNSIVQFGESG